MPATLGLLVMADISGYTAFVSGTEHEHSFTEYDDRMDAMLRGGAPSVDVA